MIAFTDSNGGYYQVDAPDGFVPDWAKNMTPCAVIPAEEPDREDTILAQIKKLEQELAEARTKQREIQTAKLPA